MSEHEYQIGENVHVAATFVECWPTSSPMRCPGPTYCEVEIDHKRYKGIPVSALRPAPPAPAEGGPFRVRCGAGSGWWVLAVDGVGNNGSVTISSTDNEAAADVFPAQWRPVFAAEPERFEIVPVEPEREETDAERVERLEEALSRLLYAETKDTNKLPEAIAGARAALAAKGGGA